MPEPKAGHIVIGDGEGPTPEQAQRVAEVHGLYWRTCDQCAETGVCLIIDGQFYICEACQGFHERALDAAHDAIRATGLVPTLRDHQIDTVAWAAVKAYTEFTDEDGEAVASNATQEALARHDAEHDHLLANDPAVLACVWCQS